LSGYGPGDDSETKIWSVDVRAKVVNGWLTDDFLATADYGRLLELLQTLQDDYSQHIAHEEIEIFPVAAATLPTEALQSIGEEMANRRGLTRSQPLASEP